MTKALSWDEFMDAFADKFRGPVATIAALHAERYLGFTQDLALHLGKPVLDIGSGRGEWLKVLKQTQIPAQGIELNEGQAERCVEQGLDVIHGDALRVMESTAEHTYSVISAIQVVEHWPPEMVFDALKLMHRLLDQQGLLILETVNVASLWAWNHFAYDPTHLTPWPPELLQFMAEKAGFSRVEVQYYSPIPLQFQLPVQSGGWEQVSHWLYGPQDYAVWARP